MMLQTTAATAAAEFTTRLLLLLAPIIPGKHTGDSGRPVAKGGQEGPCPPLNQSAPRSSKIYYISGTVKG